MSDGGDRRVGFIFGALAAGLFLLSGILNLVRGAVVLALGHPAGGLGDWSHAAILIVVGLIVGVFALIGRGRGRSESFTAGAVLLVIALVGWIGLGFTSGLLSLIGLICLLVSGLVFALAGY
ncbi:MAG TPA: hypothetical protein VEH57_00890 [Thermoplasmata archaeon]|nr:hypothetical protein [Thermoplasmata archaeon]